MAITGKATRNHFLKQEWLHPVHHPIFEQAGVSVLFLRLDKIHPLISGNKWLKLDYWFALYEANNYRGILSCGGAWSNHLHACAYACMLANIPMVAVVNSHLQLNTPTMHDLHNWGCTLERVSKTLFYDEAYWQQKAITENLLFIPMGGEGSQGKQGVTDWFDNLPLPYADACLVAVGTATTLAGIAGSTLQTGKLIGYDPGTRDKKLAEKVANLQASTGREVFLMTGTEKFGRPNPNLLDFMANWQNQTGVPLDVVYTGPLCRHLIQLCQQGYWRKGSQLLVVHTGGLQGNRSVQGWEL